MARTRLTSKVAGEIDGDVYTMNNPEKEKADPKMEEYAQGDPSAWGEDVHPGADKLNAGDEASRDKETNHPSKGTAKEAAEAVKTARQLEQKAVKCIVAAQRMLPGAADEVIEAQAADLMELPESALSATLARQEKLAQDVIAKADECAEEAEEKEAAKDEEEVEEKEAAKEEAEEEAEEKEAAKEEEEAEEKEASKDEDEEEKEAAKDEEEDEMGKEASLLDQIFSGVTASEDKKGASSLSGMVKKEASEAKDDLSGLFKSAPDVSSIFGR